MSDSFDTSKYSDEVQKVSKDTPLEEILYLLKRDGGVFVKNLITEENVDKAFHEVKDRLDNDVEWDGTFFPGKHEIRYFKAGIQCLGLTSCVSANSTGSLTDCAKPYLH